MGTSNNHLGNLSIEPTINTHREEISKLASETLINLLTTYKRDPTQLEDYVNIISVLTTAIKG